MDGRLLPRAHMRPEDERKKVAEVVTLEWESERESDKKRVREGWKVVGLEEMGAKANHGKRVSGFLRC